MDGPKWNSIEINGYIYIWYHCDQVEPEWKLEYLPDLEANGKFTFKGRTEHYVNAHIQEIPENGADVPHLNFLHRPFVFWGKKLQNLYFDSPDSGHFWEPTWHQKPEPNDKHIGVLNVTHDMKIWGLHIPLTKIPVQARQLGPAVVYMRFDFGIFGPAIMVHQVLPVEEDVIKITQEMYTTWKCPTPLAKLLIFGDALQLERDIMIWNNKTYRQNPVFVKEDSTTVKHRRYYAQFYSENSARRTASRKCHADIINDW